VRVLADRQTQRQMQTDFIMCPMLYAMRTTATLMYKDIVNMNIIATWKYHTDR